MIGSEALYGLKNDVGGKGRTDAIHSAISRAAVPLEKSRIMVRNTNSPKLQGSTAGLNLHRHNAQV